MKNLVCCNDSKLTARKIVYIVSLTSVFWFSMNILLLIASNESARESLDKLTFTSNERVDSQYMKHVNIEPLKPNHKQFDFPWMKSEFWIDRIKRSAIPVKSVTEEKPGYREVYDVSKTVNKNPGKGEGGVDAYLDTEEDKEYSKRIFRNHSFNSVLSDKISLDRTLKDVRGNR